MTVAVYQPPQTSRHDSSSPVNKICRLEERLKKKAQVLRETSDYETKIKMALTGNCPVEGSVQWQEFDNNAAPTELPVHTAKQEAIYTYTWRHWGRF